MKYKSFWKRVKRIMAIMLAFALFLNGWSNYDLSALAAGEDLTVILEFDSAVYTGEAIEFPAIKKVELGTEMISESDYEYEWNTDSAISAGLYNCVVTYIDTAGDEHTGTVEFRVEAIDLGSGDCVVTYLPLAYDGSEQVPEITVTYKSIPIPMEWLEITYAGDWVNAGSSASINIKPKDFVKENVIGEKSQSITIDTKALTDREIKAVFSPDSGYYKDEDYTPVLLIKDGDTVLKDGVDYVVSPDIFCFKEIGDYEVTITGRNNYAGNITASFKVFQNPDINMESLTVSKAVKNGDTFYFKDSAVITAKDGYELCNPDQGTITADGNVDIRVRKISDGTIGEVSLGNFKKDTTAPNVSISPVYVSLKAIENVNWAQRIESALVSATDDGAGIKAVYYTTDQDSKDYSTMSVCNNGDDLKELLESDTTYYYYAEDNLGNISARQMITVPKLDMDAPVITVSYNGKMVNEEDTIYINKNAAKVFEVGVEDGDGAGYDSEQSSIVTEFVPADMQVSEKAVIHNIAKDHVGNTVDHIFYIVYDVESPVISSAAISGENGNSILTKEDVIITANITDENLSKVEFVNVNDETDRLAMESVSGTGFTHSCTISTDGYLKKTYKIIAYDLAENNSESTDYFSVEIDKVAPVINKNNITADFPINSNEWVNQDTTFTITIENNDNSSAALYVEYKKSADPEWKKLDRPDDVSGNQWTFSAIEEDSTYNGDYLFRAGDSVGNMSEGDPAVVHLQKDKVDPETDSIYAEYKAYNGSEETGGKEQSLFRNILDKLFAKTRIEAALYIRDEISGIYSIKYVYDGSSPKKVFASEDSAVVNGVDGYTVIYLALEGDHADTLKITEIQDKAGNTVSGGNISPTVVTEGTTRLIIDNTPPTVTASYPENSGEEEKNARKYYRPLSGEKSETVLLTFKEAFYEENVDENGQPVKPSITVRKNGIEASEEELNQYLTWGEYKDGQIPVYVQLPYSEIEGGEEIEYTIAAFYQDGSENYLTGVADNFSSVDNTNGFQTGSFILDNKAPELNAYVISGNTNRQVDGVDVYQNDPVLEDVSISFTLDDHETYWDPEAVGFKIINKTTGNTVVVDSLTEDNWKSIEGSRKHIATYAFDGEDDPANYFVEITYKDRAGNIWIENGVEDGKFANGIYTSSEFILDHVAPVFNISFNDAFRLVDEKNKDYTGEEKTPVAGMTSYYGKTAGKVNIKVTIDEDYLATDDQNANGIADFEFRINGVDTAMKWTKIGTLYTGIYSIVTDGDYTVYISYQDASGNQMRAEDSVQGSTVDAVNEKGNYSSPKLVLDTVAPVVSREYTAIPANIYQGRQYFDQDTILKIRVVDQNIRYKELKDVLLKMAAEDINGKKVDNSSALSLIDGIEEYGIKRGSWDIDIPLSTNANYVIPIHYVDLAGNAAELKVTEMPTKDSALPTDLEFSYSVNNPVNYKLFGFLFAQHKMTIKASAKDETSGIHIIRFLITDEHGKKTIKEKLFSPIEKTSYEIEIPLESDDFKGTVQVQVFDWSGNQISQTRGYIVESSDRHSTNGSAVITTHTDPSRTVGGTDFYNTDVRFNLTLKDMYSGLKSFSYSGGSTLSGSRNYAEEAGSILDGKPEKEIVYEYSEDMTLSASSNNENDVPVKAEFMDNTGHTGQVEQLYNIDITAPVITVEYDLNNPSNEKYFNQTRTATVTVRERNFSSDDVDFIITNTDGAMPSIGSWSSSGSGDDTEHECNVVFSADGDYTFSVSFEDMAGNKADYNRVDEFTIDQTKPELTVSYDNNQNQNEYYYAQSRTATIDILEHNFNPALIDVQAAADGIRALSVSGWSRNGDHNIATITFSADGDYTFDISGMDLAENRLDDYETDHFVIDQTAPKLEIFDIEDMSANNGTVMPGVRYFDTNYDPNGTVILMKGCNNGIQEMNGTRKQTASGMEIKLDDFEYVPEMDDLYTMEATVCDLAGNSSEASVIFSVNRFGSVYTFDDMTALLVGESGRYYTNQEQDIVVTETNVDTLEFKEITCNLNGDLRTMKEGEDYTVRASGTDASWKQYTYTIDKDNFAEEGNYVLTIYSEDRATNTSDNNTKGKKIEFVVDKTSPSILISGVENGGQYRENSREVTLDIQDNVHMGDVKIAIDGAELNYGASEVEEMEGKIIFQIGSANHWQTLNVKAYDAAGNEQDSEEMRFLITSNIFVQFFMNRILFYSTIGAVVLIGAVMWWFFIFGRKKEKEEK